MFGPDQMVTGVSDGEEFYFFIADIRKFLMNPELTKDQAKEVADILAANVEEPDEDEGVLSIEAYNFNDSFEDMKEQLQERFNK